MIKMNTLLTIGLMLCGGTLSFAAQVESFNFDKPRYERILGLFQEQKLTQDIINAKSDIATVNQHKKILEGQLSSEKQRSATLLNWIGKGFSALAIAGGLVSTAGVIGTSSILNRPENAGMTRLGFPSYKGMQRVRGMGYFETLIYGVPNVLIEGLTGHSLLPESILGRSEVTSGFYQRLSPNEQKLIGFGVFISPLVFISSLVSAYISQHLLNKAAHYQNDITRLQTEIEQDENIIKALNI
jgi:hypothetical protein